MLTFFNRKELIITFSMQKQAEVRSQLAQHNINYYIKTININSPSIFSNTRAKTGTFGQNMDASYQYIIYVHKSDFEAANSIINASNK